MLTDAQDKRLVRNAIRRADRARNFPANTCPYSRHLQMIGEALASGKPYHMLTEEPLHCALTMLVVVEQVYKLRTELAKLKAGNE